MTKTYRGSSTWLGRVFGRIGERLRNRPDTEHMMSLNRLVFCAVFAVFLVALRPDRYGEGLIVIGIGVLVTAAIFAHILYSPAANPDRRLLAIVADMSVICYEMHLGGSVTSFFYPWILWTAFGNGLRFGLPWLLRAAALGVVGFAGLVATTPFWQENSSLTSGLFVGLVLLPLYAVVLLRSLSAAKLQAEAASEAKTLFLARVSHELRTPLHAIIGTGSLLERTTLSRDQAEMSGTIMEAGRSLLALIEDLLKTSSIESGKFPFNVAELDVPGLLHDVRGLVLAGARAKGLRVALHVGHGTPLRILSDQRRLREIILNLAGNALKFTDKGGLLISVSVARQTISQVRLRFEVADTGIGIAQSAHETIFRRFTQADGSIHDRFGGTGLGLAICKQLVEAVGGRIGVASEPGSGSTFWFEIDCTSLAGPPAQAEPAAGTIVTFGLDMPSVTTLRELADGRQTVLRHEPAEQAVVLASVAASADEGGPVIIFAARKTTLRQTVFDAARGLSIDALPALVAVVPEEMQIDDSLRWSVSTTLPARCGIDDVRAATVIAATLSGTRRGGAGRPAQAEVLRTARRVLVVDDSRINQQVMARILGSGGHGFKLVSDGEAALDALDAEEFDLVLMDVNMRGMDGIETTKLYRFTALGQRHVPIMALTADATPEMAERCHDAGMDRVIIKPVHAEEMLAIIDGVPVTVAAGPGVPAGADAQSEPRDLIAPSPLLADVAVLDTHYLDSLRSLGGPDFVADLIRDFASDAATLVDGLLQAAEQGDIDGFRSGAHALASASGNLGASRIRLLGLTMERFSADEFAALGLTRALEVEQELRSLRDAATSGNLQVS